MTPQFAKIVDPILQSVLNLVQRLERGADLDLQTEKSEIRHRFEEADKAASAAGSPISRDAFDLAKRGLVYWTDEVLTNAASAWKDIALEFEYYGESNRAWKFYVEGELKARHSSPDVVEVWYLALALGFKGDIPDAFKNHLNREYPGGATDPDEARRAWARELSRRVRSDPGRELLGEPLECGVPPLKGPFWLTLATTLLILAGVVMGGLLYLHYLEGLKKQNPRTAVRGFSERDFAGRLLAIGGH